MINIFGQGDLERWAIILLIGISLYFLWTNKNAKYNSRVKALLTMPRVYLIVYYLAVIFDVYISTYNGLDIIKSGTGSFYGVLLLFAVEAYVRRQNKKYGRC
jgi:hypothetical protein